MERIQSRNTGARTRHHGRRRRTTGSGGPDARRRSRLADAEARTGARQSRSAEIVLADGRSCARAADENPDLFWAIRGGGGNFGIAASLEYALHRSARSSPAASSRIRVAGTRATSFAFFRETCATLPDEMMMAAGLVRHRTVGRQAVGRCWLRTAEHWPKAKRH